MRVVSKTWTEEVMTFMGKSKITYTENTCPDAECQKIVDQKLKVQKEKTLAMREAREERLERIKNGRKKK